MNKELPKGWKWVRLGDVCAFVGGGTPSKNEKSYWNGNLSWASVKDVKGEYLNSTKDFISEIGLQNSSANIAEPNDVILITRISPGKTIITNIRTAINQDLKVVRPKFKTSSKFLNYYFQAFEREIVKKSSGTTVLGITLNNLNEIRIPLLDLPSQQAIVSKIEELFSELDKGIENLKTAQSQLKVYRQSVLKWAFEGKLTSLNHDSFDLSDENDLAMVAEPQEVYRSEKNQSNHTNQKNHSADNEGLPEGWKWVKLGEIANLSSLKHTPSIIENKFYVGLEHIEKERGKLLPHVGMELIKTVKNVFSIGDILYGKLRPYLNKVYLAKENGVCSTDILVFKISDACYQKYLIQLMLSKPFVNDMSNNTSGVNLPRVSTKYILNYKIPFPSFEEQTQIVQEIESRLSVADKMEETIKLSLLQAESLRQSILKKAFEGGLVK